MGRIPTEWFADTADAFMNGKVYQSKLTFDACGDAARLLRSDNMQFVVRLVACQTNERFTVKPG
ncbi:hypothetical protein LOC71_22220 [Rhodopirellula sp. JC740]|uniref:Uncharacterized protein n=1 Tax=Rhodopirellula halodulae TaxID=2894198 RepID=A0ABS8NN80_9BACT|nr:hypothetical protein [Rhodopirellula sp. JC740]MCC9645002.1 hypothetical protein [Rhodopirellula sp. JC740]